MSATGFNISSEELQKSLKQVFLLDVRQPEEFQEARIPGSTLIPLGELALRAARELNGQDDIVVICAHGFRSMQAAMMLHAMGFRKVRSLDGGIEEWKGEKLGIA